MPPERLLGKGGQIDGRSDIYSLGIVLYEVLAGRRPFDSESDYSIMEAHVKSEPAPPSSINPGISVELNRVVLKALAKDPGHRFQTANEFLSALTYAANPRPVAETPGSRIEERSAAKMAQPEGPAQGPLIPSRAGSSNRSLYMLLGSGLAVGAMVLLGVFVPIFLKTHASNKTTEPKPEIKDPVTQIVPASPPATSTTAAPAGLTTPPGGDAPQLTSTTGSSTTPTDRSVPSTNRKSDARAPQSSNKNGSTVAQVSNKSELPVGVQPPNSPNRAAIADAQNRLDELRPRVDAMNSYWNTMRAQQQKEGLDLRTSLVQELSAMNQYLNESESSLKLGNVDSANRAMDRMEENLKLLETTGK
jgi:serine/threonine-protein kinase